MKITEGRDKSYEIYSDCKTIKKSQVLQKVQLIDSLTVLNYKILFMLLEKCEKIT